MNCPNCNGIIKIIDQLSENTQTKLSDKNWYKLKEESPLICPKCNTKLKLKASKNIKTKLMAIMLIYISLALSAFFYSTALFIIMVLFIVVSSTPLVKYTTHKYGELIEDDT